MILISELIIVCLLSGIISGISYHYGYQHGENNKIESNPKYFSEKMELERASATCHSENKHLANVSEECATKLAECVNDYKVSKENEHNAIVQFTECHAVSKTKEEEELKRLDIKFDRHVLALEKANVTCHSNHKNLNEKFARSEKVRIQYEADMDRLQGVYNTLKDEYAEFRSIYKLQDKDDEKKYKMCLQSLDISATELQNCVKGKAECTKLFTECLEKVNKKWM